MNEVIKELTKSIDPPSEKDRKKMMSVYFTRRGDTVIACNHKFFGEPRNNCPDCWAAFFFTYGDISKTADECFQKEGRATLIKIKGEKFTKWFIRFMSEIQKRLKEVDQEEKGGI